MGRFAVITKRFWCLTLVSAVVTLTLPGTASALTGNPHALATRAPAARAVHRFRRSAWRRSHGRSATSAGCRSSSAVLKARAS